MGGIVGKIIFNQFFLFVIKRLKRFKRFKVSKTLKGFAANAFFYTCHCAKIINGTEFPGESLVCFYFLFHASKQLLDTAFHEETCLDLNNKFGIFPERI